MKNGVLGNYTKFKVPLTFKLGSLDNFMNLTEVLLKADHSLEGILRKLERQLAELEETDPLIDSAHGALQPLAYIQNF